MSFREAVHMNDPHVQQLRYKAIPAPFINFIEGLPVEVETPDFNARLADGELTLNMRTHFRSEEEARHLADPFVNGWAILSGLRRGCSEIRFEFIGADIIDRSPAPNTGTANIRTPPSQLAATGISHPIKKAYPKPSSNFSATPEVEILWARYQAYFEGRESLLSMAYYCLTFVERLAGGGSQRASKKYKISNKLFEKIGSLTGEAGDYLTARKAEGPPKPLSQEDLRWLDAAIRLIIRRVGEPPTATDKVITVDEVINSRLIALDG
jgi:hypothetical protein